MKYDLIEAFGRILKNNNLNPLSDLEIKVLNDLNDSGLVQLDGIRASDVVEDTNTETPCREFYFTNDEYFEPFVLKVFKHHAIAESTVEDELLRIRYDFHSFGDYSYITLASLEMNRDNDVLVFKYIGEEAHKNQYEVKIFTDAYHKLKDDDEEEKPVPDLTAILERTGSLQVIKPKNCVFKNGVDYFYNSTGYGSAHEAASVLCEMDDAYRAVGKLNGKQKVLK